MTPRRIQLSRKKGWKMPPNTVKVDRTTPYGNPFHTHGDGVAYDPALAVRMFRESVRKLQAIVRTRKHRGRQQVMVIEIDEIKNALRGHDLACWCKIGAPCHADVLLEIANA